MRKKILNIILTEIPIYGFNEKVLSSIQYPVIVKPVDNGGGVGMRVCNNKKELKENAKYAHANSHSGRFLTERFMSCDDMLVFITTLWMEKYF